MDEIAESGCQPTQHLESAVFFPFSMRLHISINVPDIEPVLPFYMGLFNATPVKMRGDYAKFELDDPPINLTLNQHPPELASREFLTLEVADEKALAECAERLSKVGAVTDIAPSEMLAEDACGNRWHLSVRTPVSERKRP